MINPLYPRSLPRLVRLVLVVLAAVGHGLAAPIKFEIPAQAAPDAIMLFSKQARVEVVFSVDDLRSVQTPEVRGELEPEEALSRLLKASGFTGRRNGGGKFVIGRASVPAAVGSIHGTLAWPDGTAAEGVRVALGETGQSTRTDPHGAFTLADVRAGTFVLVATSAGFQPLHITGIAVRAGRDITLSRQTMRKAEDVEKLEPFVVRAEAVTELDRYEVTDRRTKPYSTGNVDLPRTVNDIQPYTIFDAATLERTSSLTIEDFLRKRLTMNTLARTDLETTASTLQAKSAIDLRGLGTASTLILVDGRRMAGVQQTGATSALGQPDLNGISLASVDRIEVLPTSASGIYGGSALGGVVNIILKRNYTGGDLLVSYDTPWDTDAPRRNATLNWGFPLGSKTQAIIRLGAGDGGVITLGDRYDQVRRYQRIVLANAPSLINSPGLAPLASTPNIFSLFGDNLVFDDGTPVGSTLTSIAPGTSAQTSAAVLKASLLARAGRYNLEPADTVQWFGLRSPIGNASKSRSASFSLRHRLTQRIEVFIDLMYSTSSGAGVYNPFTNGLQLAGSSPFNPFQNFISISHPNNLSVEISSRTRSRSATLGANVDLPGNWTGEADYTYSDSNLRSRFYSVDPAFDTDLAAGLINPFTDLLAFPVDLSKYLYPTNQNGGLVAVHDLSARSSGPLFSLPWGTPRLATGLHYRLTQLKERTTARTYVLSPQLSDRTTVFAKTSETAAVYSELQSPLLPRARFPWAHSLDLQLAGRAERFQVDTGTPSKTVRLSTGAVTYANPTKGGQPFESQAEYSSVDFTAGFAFRPVESITLRASTGTAFLSPVSTQLLRNAEVSTALTTITEPTTGVRYAVQTIGGGNPDLLPQTSRSQNAGLIWMPTHPSLRGLRLNVEWYHIATNDRIGTLTAQQILNEESKYQSRVTRDPATGRVTLIDVSNLNLFHNETMGYDFGVDHRLATRVGDFNLHGGYTRIVYDRRQASYTTPIIDYAGHVAGGGAAKHKLNGDLVWEKGRWGASWTVRFYGKYKQSGAVDGPSAFNAIYVTAQGSEFVGSQIYHDATLSYSLGRLKSEGAVRSRVASAFSDLSLRVGMNNVFNQPAPFDALNQYSVLGDIRMRTVWVSVKKSL